ncbi:MAG TPA: hypothetical protein VHW66_20405 [Stellaceae bacterium]|nr:hypothetical protein [Stellaceae bacterium]
MTVNTLAGNGPILFQGAGTIDGDGVAGRNLTLTAGSGAITVGAPLVGGTGGAVGGTVALATLTATTTGTITLDGSVTTTGAQTYSDTTLDLNGPNYTTKTSGAFTETGATQLTNNVTIDTSAGSQNIAFQLPVGTIDGAFGLTLNAGTGAVTVAGNIGGVTPLASLSVMGGMVTFGGGVTTTAGPVTVHDGSALQLPNVTTAGLLSVFAGGALTQGPGTAITAGSLEAVTELTAGAPITLSSPTNLIPGTVTLSALNTAGTATAPGAITFVDNSGFTVAPIALGGLNGQEKGVVNDPAPIYLTVDKAGATFTNDGAIDSTGGVPALGSDILILADLMNLHAGSPSTINAGNARVVLGPFTQSPSQTITLQGTGGTAGGGLNLTNADLGTITSGLLQIGSSSATYSNGAITVSGAVVVPSTSATLALVSSGDIADASGAETLSVTNLALNAGGKIHLKGANPVSMLAGQSAGGDFDFLDGSALLTVGTVPTTDPIAAIGIAASSGSLTNAALTPIVGITSSGAVNLTATGSVTIATPISAGTTVAIQDSGALAINSPVASSTVAGGLEAEFFSDQLTIGAPVTFGSGLVLLAPNTLSRGIDLGGSSATALELTNASLNEITAKIIQIGYTNAFNGSITVSGPIHLAATQELGLLTGTFGGTSGSISESTGTPAGTITTGSLALSAAGSVSMPNANSVGVIAGQAGGSFMFRDDSTTLTIGAVGNLVSGPAGIDPDFLGVATANGNIILEATTSGNLVLADPVNAGSMAVALGSAGTITQTGAGLLTGAALETVSSDYTELGLANTIGTSGAAGTLAGRVLTAGRSYLVNDTLAGGLTVGTVNVVDTNGVTLLNPTTPAVFVAQPVSGVATQDGAILIEATGNLALSQPVDAGLDFTPTTALALASPLKLAAAPAAIGLSSGGQITQSGSGILVGGAVETVSVNSTELGLANLVGNAGGAGTPGMLAGTVSTAGQSFLFRDDSNSLTVGTLNVSSTPGTLFQPTALSGVKTNNGNLLIEATTSGNLLLTQAVDAGTMAVALGSAGTITQSGPGLLSGTALETVSSGYTELGLANTIGTAGGAGTVAGRVLTAGQSYLVDDASAGGLTVGAATVADTNNVTLLNPTTPAVSVSLPLSGVATQDGAILIEAAGNLAFTQAADAALDFAPATALALASPPTLSAAPGSIALISGGQITQTGSGILVGAAVETVSATSTELGLANLVGNAGGTGTPGMLAGTVSTAAQSFLFRDDSNSLTVGTLNVSSTPGTLFQPTALSGVTTKNGSLLIETTTSGNLLLTQAVNAGSGSVALGSAGTITQNAVAGSITGANLEILSQERVSLGTPADPATNTIGTSSASGVLAAQIVNSGESLVVADGAAQGMTLGSLDVVDTGGLRLIDQRATPAALLTGGLSGATTNNANIALRTTAGPLALAASIGAGAGSVGLESTASTISQTAGTITATVLEANSAGAVSLPDGNAVANLAGQVTGSGSFIFVDQTSLAIDPVAAVLEQGTGASSPGAPMLTIAGLSQISAPGDVEVTTKGAATLSGTYSLTGTRVALSASGNFTQTGSTTVTADYLLVDTTGLGAAALVADVPTPTMALASVATEPGLGPHGASNTMNFNGTVSAAGTQTVLFGGHGTVDSVSGGLLVKGLLVSGAGGSAGLFGSIGGIATSTAAQEGLINPSSSNNYRFNTCVIGSVSCILLPALIPVEPQAATQIDILVARPAVEDLDAPLVDIFDEQRLCEQLLRTDPKRAREYCQ